MRVECNKQAETSGKGQGLGLSDLQGMLFPCCCLEANLDDLDLALGSRFRDGLRRSMDCLGEPQTTHCMWKFGLSDSRRGWPDGPRVADVVLKCHPCG